MDRSEWSISHRRCDVLPPSALHGTYRSTLERPGHVGLEPAQAIADDVPALANRPAARGSSYANNSPMARASPAPKARSEVGET